MRGGRLSPPLLAHASKLSRISRLAKPCRNSCTAWGGDGGWLQGSHDRSARQLNGVCLAVFGYRGWPAFEIPVAERDCPQHLICIKDDGPRDVVLCDLVDCLRLDLRVGALTVVLILGDGNMTGTRYS